MKLPKKISHDLQGILDSPLQKALRDVDALPAMKAARDLMESPTMRMMRELQDSPTMRMVREMQDSPTMRMMRDLQAQSDRFSALTRLASDFSGGLPARVALHDYNRITAVGALAGNLADGFSDKLRLCELRDHGSFGRDDSCRTPLRGLDGGHLADGVARAAPRNAPAVDEYVEATCEDEEDVVVDGILFDQGLTRSKRSHLGKARELGR